MISRPPDALLAGFALEAAAGSPYTGTLRLEEYETRTQVLEPPPPEGYVQEYTRLMEPASIPGLASLSFAYGADGRLRATVRASSIVGFATVSDPAGGKYLVAVEPKVPTVRMLELAAMAGLLPRWRADEVELTRSVDSSLVEWTLRALREAVVNLLNRGGLRSLHERSRAELRGRVRGRILIGGLLRNIARGRPELVPCEYPALERDNGPNRLLRWALRTATIAADSMEATRDLAGEFRRLESAFSLVALVEPPRGRTETVLPSNMRHYREAVEIAQFLLDAVHLYPVPGHSPAVTVALDMNVVYERAFFAGLVELEPRARPQDVWPIRVDEVGTTRRRRARMRPDIFIPETGTRCPIVIDTKWKDSLAQETTDEVLLTAPVTKTLQVRNSDLYQIVAYAAEALSREPGAQMRCVAALVYPTLDETPTLRWVLTIGGSTVEVYLVPWDLRGPVRPAVNAVWRILAAAATGDDVEVQQLAS